ncbi:MAG: hypothetical protein MJY95_07965 [Bacteroidaceae bacterium]|nr:hypothetical protein [Bacteroidaceae bacterium]
MIKFLFSRHCATYIRIAKRYGCWPEKVYKLAHKPNSVLFDETDEQIMHDLKVEGVIQRKKHHHHHH